MTGLIVPAGVVILCLWAQMRSVDVFSAMIDGAKRGMKTVAAIFPSLAVMLTVIAMLRASGVLELAGQLLSPVFDFFGIPEQTAAIILVRPFSGSGALAAAGDILTAFGADSFPGRVASVMVGSTETTFYVLAVYSAAVRAKKLHRAIPAALAADVTGYIFAALTVRMFFR